jgi:hypothetical protein
LKAREIQVEGNPDHEQLGIPAVTIESQAPENITFFML